MPRKSLEEKLLDLSVPEPNSGCWLWLGAMMGPRDLPDRRRYGHLNLNPGNLLAHRAAYLCWCGEIPDGLDVMHRCDNSLCINPAHLELGTRAQNSRDQSTRLRHPSKLTEPQADMIRRRVAAGELQKDLAREYGVDKKTIYNAINTKRIYRAPWMPRPERVGRPPSHAQ